MIMLSSKDETVLWNAKNTRYSKNEGHERMKKSCAMRKHSAKARMKRSYNTKIMLLSKNEKLCAMRKHYALKLK
jgi:hypothetical protein